MAGRKYLLIIVALLAAGRAKSQQLTFNVVDSTSYALYMSSNWHQLIDYGQRAIASGTDFPTLRSRMGFAYFSLGNYGQALTQYQKVLKHDSQNPAAHELAYWSNSFLNRGQEASYHASFLDTTVRNGINISPFGLIAGDIETGIKLTNDTYRGTASYNRIGLSNRLGWRLQLDQSLVYYGQSIKYHRRSLYDFRDEVVNNSINQEEYFGKLSYTLNSKWLLLGSYHYLNASYREEKYHNNVGIFGINYAGSYMSWQADADLAQIYAHAVTQYNAKLTLMPSGNLNFYLISRASILHQNSASNFIFNQNIGGRLVKNFWLDANVIIGSLNNYMDADGLYVYDAIDVTKFDTGATAYYQAGKHALLYVNYAYERKQDFYGNINAYNQHSITGGVKWKF